MARHYEFLSMRERGVERREAGFEEALYDATRQTPWWLASAGFHVLLFLVLSVLADGSARAQDRTVLATSVEKDPVAMEEEIEPQVVATPPLDEPEDVLVTPDLEEVKSDDEAEMDAQEAQLEPADSRFDGQGPFDGPGKNGDIGAGGDVGGGPLGHRARRRNLRAKSGSDTDPIVLAGLEWLKNHQSPDGAWDCDGFESMCRKNKCGGPGGPLYDPGVSGLALLAFLGYGETHKSERYGRVVRNGLKYLKAIQDPEGCFGPRTSGHFTYNHAIGALAMAEAYGMTQSPLFKASAQRGIDFVQQCRNPYLAWRYGVKPQDNDTSVTGWMVMALKSAHLVGLAVDPDAFAGARDWMDRVTEPEYGRAGYTARGNGPARPQELLDKFPPDKSESLTAVAVLVRVFSGTSTEDAVVRKGADLCLKNLPRWDEAAGTIDYYYWYYGALAMFQVGGDHWKRWNAAMAPALIEHQHRDPTDDRFGSWDPVDPWWNEGGRVYATALNTMSMEVSYRYDRVCGTK